MKAFYKTALGENVDSTNQDIMVGTQDNARAKISAEIKSILASPNIQTNKSIFCFSLSINYI